MPTLQCSGMAEFGGNLGIKIKQKIKKFEQ
jgi:hypothetical protein